MPPRPILPLSVTVGGIQATVQYAGGAPAQAVGLTQVNVQIPNGVQPGGYVPVVLQVGDVTTTPGACGSRFRGTDDEECIMRCVFRFLLLTSFAAARQLIVIQLSDNADADLAPTVGPEPGHFGAVDPL